MSDRDKVRGLFKLYNDEKKAETKTRDILTELEDNSSDVLQAKLRLIEKVLGIKVKDELTIMRKTSNVAIVETNSALIRKKARERITMDSLSLLPTARDKYPDAFVTHFESLASQPEEEIRSQIAQGITDNLDTELGYLKARRQTAVQEGNMLDSIKAEKEQVRSNGEREILSNIKSGTPWKDPTDRIARVHAAEEILSKLKPQEILTDTLSELMHCTPVSFNTDIGKLEAEINDLRSLIYNQRAEEERLLLERSAKLSAFEIEQSDLQKEVNDLVTKLSDAMEEIEAKEMETVHMRESQVPKIGKWDVEISGLKDSVEFGNDEEMKLKRDYEGVSHAVGQVDANKSLLEEKVHDELSSLKELQDEYRTIVDKIEEQLLQHKTDIVGYRQQVLASTKRINELRWKARHGGEEARDVKRSLKERVVQAITQLTVEERLQRMMQAKLILLEQDAEHLRSTWNDAISTQTQETQRHDVLLRSLTVDIQQRVDELADLKTGMQAGVSQGAPPLTAANYEAEIENRNRSWPSLVFDTARRVADVKANILVYENQSEMILESMGHIVVTGKILQKEGIDIETATNAQLASTANRMYDDLARASHRESKINMLIRIFKNIQERRAAGEQIGKLTGKRHLSRAERRSKRDVRDNSALAQQIAKQNLSLQSAYPTSIGDGYAVCFYIVFF